MSHPGAKIRGHPRVGGSKRGPDGLPAESLKVLTHDGYLYTLGKFRDVIVAVSRAGGEPQQWAGVTMKAPHKKKYRTGCGNNRGISLEGHAGKVLLQVSPGRLIDYYCVCKTFCRKNSVG